MGESNRTIRQRMLDRVVMRYVGLLLLIAVVCPTVNNRFLAPHIDVIPLYPDRPACNELPAPLGGNQRSLLAYESDPTGALELEVSMADRITVGSPVEVTVTFKNTHEAPIILHFPTAPDPEFLITTNAASQGVNFLLEYNGNLIGQPSASYTSPATFSPTTLHLLGPRSDCQQIFTLPWATLQSIGANLGTYRIRARYGNALPGNNPTGFPEPLVATAIPEYTVSQGVWVGEATSNEVRFEIVTPTPTQIPQPGQ